MCAAELSIVLDFLVPIGLRLKEISNKARSEKKSDILLLLVKNL